ncbi:hypothetical protein [Paenibacillus sp. P36]|uniref:hypothetical protein n=1 Tax=Paenibacillus sp. P36 TaxID=3342538 RepID=UPI0038B3DA27
MPSPSCIRGDASAETDGKPTVILHQIVAGNEITVETPSISVAAARNPLDPVKSAVETPLN